MKENKSQNGITLVALVITVIIMLVIAGVGIGIITGENGLFARAIQATVEHTEGAQKEADRVNVLNVYFDQYDIN